MSLAEAQVGFGRMLASARLARLTVRRTSVCSDAGYRARLIWAYSRLARITSNRASRIGPRRFDRHAHPGLIRDVVSSVLELAGDKPVFLHLHDTEEGHRQCAGCHRCGGSPFRYSVWRYGRLSLHSRGIGKYCHGRPRPLVHQLGYHTGIDLHRCCPRKPQAESLYGAKFPGKMHRVIHRAQARVAS